MTFSVRPPALRTYAGQLAAAKAADTAASTWTGWRAGDGEGSCMGEIRDMGDLMVSVENLDAAAEYVERLKQYVDDTISYEMERIKERMKGDSNNAQTVPPRSGRTRTPGCSGRR